MKLSCAQLVSDIVAPLSTSKAITKQSEVVNQVYSSSESDYISDSDVQEQNNNNDEDQQMTPRHSPHASLIPIHTPQVGINATPGSSKLPALKPSTRPQVGVKTPKSSFPPRKCINVSCKEEKQELRNNIAALKQQIEDLKAASSSKAQRAVFRNCTRGVVLSCESKGPHQFCNIKDVTRLWPSQPVLSKAGPCRESGLRELDHTIVNAIADFAVVAKIPTPPESQDKGKKGSSDESVDDEAMRVDDGHFEILAGDVNIIKRDAGYNCQIIKWETEQLSEIYKVLHPTYASLEALYEAEKRRARDARKLSSFPTISSWQPCSRQLSSSEEEMLKGGNTCVNKYRHIQLTNRGRSYMGGERSRAGE
ncbi:hypothetical protein OS493_010595 [Desmophyllum pertusum]|uniref:Uncharacterized protein n=1 Tax=Desmophyllum pertusum TaxID=174260 RepID=A0A9X0D3R0_9CNID|nr:hypothetical protein OS493_010595 [Desmophyllum pertusum]